MNAVTSIPVAATPDPAAPFICDGVPIFARGLTVAALYDSSWRSPAAEPA